MFRQSFRLFGFDATKESVLKVNSTQNLGKLSAAVKSCLNKKRPTSLLAGGKDAVYTAVRSVIQANIYEQQPRPMIEKIMEPLKLTENEKVAFQDPSLFRLENVKITPEADSSTRASNTPQSSESEEIPFIVTKDIQCKDNRILKAGWQFLGEVNETGKVVQQAKDLSVFSKPGQSTVLFKRLAEAKTDIKPPSNPTYFSLSPLLVDASDEGNNKSTKMQFDLHCLDKPPAPIDENTVFFHHSPDIEKAAFGLNTMWKQWLYDGSMSPKQAQKLHAEGKPVVPVSSLVLKAIGKNSVLTAMHICALAQKEDKVRMGEWGFVLHPSFYQESNGITGIAFSLVPRRDVVQ